MVDENRAQWKHTWGCCMAQSLLGPLCWDSEEHPFVWGCVCRGSVCLSLGVGWGWGRDQTEPKVSPASLEGRISQEDKPLLQVRAAHVPIAWLLMVTARTCLPSPPLLTSSRWMVFPLPAVCLGPHPLASMAVLLGSLRLASSRLLFAHRETCSTKQGVSGVPVCT